MKNWLIWNDPDAGKDWRREKKGTTEDEVAGWHHWLNGHEFEHPPGVGDGQGGRECCSPWSCTELDTTERLNWTATLNLLFSYNECWEEKLKNAFLYETLQHSYTEKIVVILVKPESVVEKFQRIQQPFTEHLVLVTQLCLTPWTVACWAPLSMGFSREEDRSG